MRLALEALILGLSSGPACLASCGPVLLPWLTAESRPFRSTSFRLAQFLTGRLGGYLLFAALAWGLGMTLPAGSRPRAVIFGLVHVGMAGALVYYVLSSRKKCPGCGNSKSSAVLPLTLGFFTGLNFCPPFLAAGVRAAEAQGLAAALFFFLFFFVGTAVWFLPFGSVAWLRRFQAVASVARLVVLLLAGYYIYLGLISLGGALLYAR